MNIFISAKNVEIVNFTKTFHIERHKKSYPFPVLFAKKCKNAICNKNCKFMKKKTNACFEINK